VSELVLDEHGFALYALPLRFPSLVGELSLRVELDRSAVAELRQNPIAGLCFTPSVDGALAEITQRDFTAAQDLLIAVPPIPRESVRVEAASDGAHYFVVDDRPTPPSDRPAGDPPKRVGLLWDASLSRASADTTREIALVRRWLADLGEVEVVLTVFRDAPEPPRSFRVAGGDAAALVAALEALPTTAPRTSRRSSSEGTSPVSCS